MIRDVVRQSGYRGTGRFGSKKNGRMLGWESPLEKARFMLLELDPDVLSFEEQPMKIAYFFAGKMHEYTPDILVRRHSSSRDTLEEIKAQYFLDSDPAAPARFHAIEECCEELGYSHMLLTERDILAEPRYSNACRVRKARHFRVPPHLAKFALEAAEDSDGAAFTELERVGLSQGQILNLVFQGLLHLDFDKPIDGRARLERSYP